MIQARVAQILSPFKVVLSAGSEKGVREGMEFVIYDLGDVVIDPETGESLGQLELHKARIKVSHVQDRMSVATTRSRTVERPATLVAEMFATAVTKTVYEKLPLDKSTNIPSAEPELTVKVGDHVRSVSEPIS